MSGPSAVPWVPSLENQREPPEALPAVAVPLVPPVPSEKSKGRSGAGGVGAPERNFGAKIGGSAP